jgi:dihydrofolate reductase
MNIVVAVCKNGGIGYKNALPWALKKELNYFKHLTIGNGNNAIIMGKNTWLSMPKLKSLPKRENFVLSKSINKNLNAKDFTFIKSMKRLDLLMTYNDIWIIGGEQVYKNALQKGIVQNIFLTKIDKNYKCDTFFPDFSDNFTNIHESETFIENDTPFRMGVYTNNKYNHESFENFKLRQIKKCEQALKRIK